MFYKFFKSDSLTAQLEREHMEAETARLTQEQAEQESQQQRIAAEQQAATDEERAKLDADIHLATAAVEAFEKAAAEAMLCESRIYQLLYRDRCPLERQRPAPFEQERRQALGKLRGLVARTLQKSGYTPRYEIGGGGAAAIPATAAPAAPPSPAFTFSGRSWATGEPIHE